MDNNENVKIFYCYSKRLKNFLSLCGFEYCKNGINRNTQNEFWGYKNSEDLTFALNEWAKIKEYFDDKIKLKLSGKDNIIYEK